MIRPSRHPDSPLDGLSLAVPPATWAGRRLKALDSPSSADPDGVVGLISRWAGHAEVGASAGSPKLGASTESPRAPHGPREDQLHHHQAAVDGQHLAGDVRRLVGGEEGDCVGDLARLAEAAQGGALDELGLEIVGQVLGQLRDDEARAPPRCTVMPRLASSRAVALVSPMSPALADE